MVTKKSEDSKESLKTIWIVICMFPIACLGFFLTSFDGWCGFTDSCRNEPGIGTVFGAFLMALYVQVIISRAKKAHKKPDKLTDLLWTPAIIAIIYLIKLGDYHHIINLDIVIAISTIAFVCFMLYLVFKKDNKKTNHKDSKK